MRQQSQQTSNSFNKKWLSITNDFVLHTRFLFSKQDSPWLQHNNFFSLAIISQVCDSFVFMIQWSTHNTFLSLLLSNRIAIPAFQSMASFFHRLTVNPNQCNNSLSLTMCTTIQQKHLQEIPPASILNFSTHQMEAPCNFNQRPFPFC